MLVRNFLLWNSAALYETEWEIEKHAAKAPKGVELNENKSDSEKTRCKMLQSYLKTHFLKFSLLSLQS